MSLPSPSPYIGTPGNIEPRKMSPQEQIEWDAPYIALAQKSGGDLRLLFSSFFSFLHRKTDFYIAHHPLDVKEGIPVRMGFKEGDAEKLLLASFRQFPLRRLPRMSEVDKKKQEQQQEQQQQRRSNSQTSIQKNNNEKSDKNSNKQNNKDGTKNVKNEKPSTTGEPKTSTATTTATVSSTSETAIKYSEEGKQIPVGNGGSCTQFNFEWTQTIQEVSIALPIPPKTRAKDLEVIMKQTSISVKLPSTNIKTQSNDGNAKNDAVDKILLEGTLNHTVRTDESTWTIEDNVLLIVLDKKDKTWWDSVVQTSNDRDKIDTTLVDSTSKISEYDAATQGMIRKILFDQRQERLGLPSSDDILRKEAKNSGDLEKINSMKSSMITSENMPTLPPGVEYIDKSNFPPSTK